MLYTLKLLPNSLPPSGSADDINFSLKKAGATPQGPATSSRSPNPHYLDALNKFLDKQPPSALKREISFFKI